ncbi:MAG: enoyl-CoA hydratase/isomerase family protein [Parvibaculaceae bacterium]
MPDLGDKRILLAAEGHVATLTIARPEKLNALDMGMVAALERAAALVEAANEIRVVILTGAGEKSFCAGGDIEAWAENTPLDFGRSWIRHGHRAFDALARLRQPVIAVLNGHVLGGGLELAAVADLRIAETHVRIGAPETGLGMIPGWSGTQRVVRRFGAQLTRRMALFGEIFSAEEALALGLVDAVADTGEGMAKAQDYAARLLERGPVALELAKALINAAEGEEVERPLEAFAGALVASTLDLKEGVAAFRGKRKPKFRNE